MVFVNWRLCINIYAWQVRCQHNVSLTYLVWLKMEPNKEHIRDYLLFCFHQKKSAADAHRIICEMYGENIIAIRTVWIGLNNLKVVISISVTKNVPNDLQLEENELQKESWKTMKNISINLYWIDFFYCNKMQKVGNNFYTDLMQ